MASIKQRSRKDGSAYFDVMFRLDGRQRSVSFETTEHARKFKELIELVGPGKAMEVYGLKPASRSASRGLTLTEWVTHHIDHLTGINPVTLARYRAFLTNDIEPAFGNTLLTDLSSDDIACWINTLEAEGASAKTVKNKHGFLSAALQAAVRGGHISVNPCNGNRLPRWNRAEIVFLSPVDFQRLLDEITPHWRPLVKFLVASGCRWGEAVALQPIDVDRSESTVRINKAWRYGPGGYTLGTPKTPRSVRTINVDESVLQELHYDQKWLFVNRIGEPVRIHGFHRRVWTPAVKRAQLPRTPRIHDLRHTFIRLDADSFNQLASTGNLLRDALTLLAAAAWWAPAAWASPNRSGPSSASRPAGGFSPHQAEPLRGPLQPLGPLVSHARLHPSP